MRNIHGPGQRIIHERSRNELAGLIVNNFFKQGLAHRLSYAPMDLTSHQHRIDLLAAIIDCDITLEMDLAGFRINLYHSYVRAERKRKVFRLVECRG